MITKSEEEWLIDEAIYKKIDRLLIKPINPNQVFAACKQVLEGGYIFSEKSNITAIANINVIANPNVNKNFLSI